MLGLLNETVSKLLVDLTLGQYQISQVTPPALTAWAILVKLLTSGKETLFTKPLLAVLRVAITQMMALPKFGAVPSQG